jgi:hypothetical protein
VLNPPSEGVLYLVERSQAASAHLYLAGLALLIDGCLLNVHPKLALGVPHRVADIMAELRGLAANLTFCHWMSASISQFNTQADIIPYHSDKSKSRGCVQIWGRITLIRGVRHPQMPNGAASRDAGSSFAPKNERTHPGGGGVCPTFLADPASRLTDGMVDKSKST